MKVVLMQEQISELQNLVRDVTKKEIEGFNDNLKTNTKYVNKSYICKYLNKSNNTVDKLIAAGLPQIKVNGVTLYNKDEIDEWLKTYSSNTQCPV